MGAYSYDIQGQIQQLSTILERHLSNSVWHWLQDSTAQASVATKHGEYRTLQVLFSRVARKVKQEQGELNLPKSTPSGIFLPGDLPQIARFWILLQLPVESEDHYLESIEVLFKRADMGELTALYRALPALAFPALWVWRCSEGIRNNMDVVLKAIMLDNPYPAEHLNEAAWNQLVLKAFFTDQDVSRIQGEPGRRNPALAQALKDYKDERLSAGRTLHAELENMIKSNELK